MRSAGRASAPSRKSREIPWIAITKARIVVVLWHAAAGDPGKALKPLTSPFDMSHL